MPRCKKPCARCGVVNGRYGVAKWPEGFVCGRCYYRAMQCRGACPACGVERLLPGLDADRVPICRDCAGIPRDFHCTRCGEEADRGRRGLCHRCCLQDDLATLLDDGTGQIAPPLRPLVDALVTQDRPVSARLWARFPHVKTLLRGLADGSLPLDHETFDNFTPRHAAEHTRELLVTIGVLAERNRAEAEFLRWLEWKTPQIANPEDQQLVRRFATWHHLRRLRELDARGAVAPTTVARARADVRAGADFLAWLRERGRSPMTCTQGHVDEWLATGTGTRRSAATFVHWAVRTRVMASVDFPWIRSAKLDSIGQSERLHFLRRIAEDGSIRLETRILGLLVLLFAQPVTRISRMSIDDIEITDKEVTVRLTGGEAVPVPHPFDQLFRNYLPQRRHTTTARNNRTRWLFPGAVPGQPLTIATLHKGLWDSGIPIRRGRNSALRDLVLEMPPALVAKALGYSSLATELHAAQAGRPWAGYAPIRRYRGKQLQIF